MKLVYPYLHPSVQLRWRLLSKTQRDVVKRCIPRFIYVRMQACGHNECRSEIITDPKLLNRPGLCDAIVIRFIYNDRINRYMPNENNPVFRFAGINLGVEYRQQYRFGVINNYREYMDGNMSMKTLILNLGKSMADSILNPR